MPYLSCHMPIPPPCTMNLPVAYTPSEHPPSTRTTPSQVSDTNSSPSPPLPSILCSFPTLPLLDLILTDPSLANKPGRSVSPQSFALPYNAFARRGSFLLHRPFTVHSIHFSSQYHVLLSAFAYFEYRPSPLPSTHDTLQASNKHRTTRNTLQVF